MAEENEIELGTADWQQRLIHRHSARGKMERILRSIKRRKKSKYATCGLITGLLVGAAVGGLLWYLIW